MPSRLRFIKAATIGICAALVSGCAGGPALPSLGEAATGTASGAPTDVYTRIARGALACWFGPAGRLTATHLFHADAAPPASGGRVEIVIHERAPQPTPWGLKAFRIGLSGASGQTSIEVENFRLAESAARQMRAEVFAWAQGEETCERTAAPPLATSSLPAAAPKARR